MKRKTPGKPILLVALGGNALIQKGQQGTIEQQFKNLKGPIRQIAGLSSAYRIIITHGNGPQVGNLLLQQESCSAVPRLPLEILVAQTEGQIGYMIESTLDEALMAQGILFFIFCSLGTEKTLVSTNTSGMAKSYDVPNMERGSTIQSRSFALPFLTSKPT